MEIVLNVLPAHPRFLQVLVKIFDPTALYYAGLLEISQLDPACSSISHVYHVRNLDILKMEYNSANYICIPPSQSENF